MRDAARWPSEVGRDSERTRFKRSSRSIRSRSRALRSISPGVDLDSSGSDENEVSLARKESRTDFPEVSLQLLDPTEWKWRGTAAYHARKTS